MPFSALGLSDSTDYLVYEAWTHRFAGIERGTLTLGAIAPAIGAEALCIRARLDRPQIVTTSRHITCGGPDLQDVTWKENELSGVSDIVGGEPYDIVVHEPAGTTFVSGTVEGAARATSNTVAGGLRTIRVAGDASTRIRWRMIYRTTSRSQ